MSSMFIVISSLFFIKVAFFSKNITVFNLAFYCFFKVVSKRMDVIKEGAKNEYWDSSGNPVFWHGFFACFFGIVNITAKGNFCNEKGNNNFNVLLNLGNMFRPDCFIKLLNKDKSYKASNQHEKAKPSSPSNVAQKLLLKLSF